MNTTTTANDKDNNMTKRINKADTLVALAEFGTDPKAWHKAGLACRAVSNNTTDQDIASKYTDLHETCVAYARHYR